MSICTQIAMLDAQFSHRLFTQGFLAEFNSLNVRTSEVDGHTARTVNNFSHVNILQNFSRCPSFPKGCFPNSCSASNFQSETDNLVCCWGKPRFTLVNLCLSSFLLCSLCSKSNEHTSLFRLSWNVFCFSFLKIAQFSKGFRVLFTAVETRLWSKSVMKQINAV